MDNYRRKLELDPFWEDATRVYMGKIFPDRDLTPEAIRDLSISGTFRAFLCKTGIVERLEDGKEAIIADSGKFKVITRRRLVGAS